MAGKSNTPLIAVIALTGLAAISSSIVVVIGGEALSTTQVMLVFLPPFFVLIALVILGKWLKSQSRSSAIYFKKKLTDILGSTGNTDEPEQQAAHDENDLDAMFEKIGKKIQDTRNVRNQFTRIIAPELLDAMLDDDKIIMGGKKTRGALLFLDIRGFTAIAQRRDPEQVLDILNTFFGKAVPLIEMAGGIVDKFVGDGLMALFGIPNDIGNNALCATQAAIEIQDLARSMNDQTAYGRDVRLHVGIGLAKGNVIAGTIGAEHRLSYTAVGATVNLAARLCSIAKRGEIVCCNFSHLDVKEHVETKRSSPIMLKGIDVPIYTYKVNG